MSPLIVALLALSSMPVGAQIHAGSFAVLMHMNFDGHTSWVLFFEKEAVWINVCGKFQIYDFEQGVCRDLLCPPQHVFHEDRCVPIADAPPDTIDPSVFIKLSVKLMACNDTVLDTEIDDNFNMTFLEWTGMKTNVTQVEVVKTLSDGMASPETPLRQSSSQQVLGILVEVTMFDKADAILKEMTTFRALLERDKQLWVGKQCLYVASWAAAVLSNNTSTAQAGCLGVEKFYQTDSFNQTVVNDPDTNGQKTYIFVPDENSYYKPGEYDISALTVMDDTTGATNTDVGVTVCNRTPRIREKCPYGYLAIHVNDSSVRIGQNRSLFWTTDSTTLIHTVDEYQQQDGSYVVCALPRRELEVERLLGEIQAYLTFTLTVLSAVAMVAFLITYGIFPQLRNLPGWNMIFFTTSLLGAELLFLVGTNSAESIVKGVCLGLAIAVHYLFLAAFFWSNVMAFDLMRTFSDGFLLHAPSLRKTVPRYSLYAWCAPAIIVAVALAVDLLTNNSTKPCYAGFTASNTDNLPVGNRTTTYSTEHVSPVCPLLPRNFCWLQNQVGILVYFGGPILFVLIANGILYVKTVINIRDNGASRLHVRRYSQTRLPGNDDVKIYAKMALIMGFTWVTGFSSLATGTAKYPEASFFIGQVLNFLFIIFNTLQGLFVFIVFVCNRRVAGLYRAKFSALSKSPQTATTGKGTRTPSITTLSQTVQHVPAVVQNKS